MLNTFISYGKRKDLLVKDDFARHSNSSFSCGKINLNFLWKIKEYVITLKNQFLQIWAYYGQKGLNFNCEKDSTHISTLKNHLNKVRHRLSNINSKSTNLILIKERTLNKEINKDNYTLILNCSIIGNVNPTGLRK